MNYKQKILHACVIALSALTLISNSGCNEGFLDIKPDRTMVVPQTLSDLQGMLDNTGVMNRSNVGFLSVLISDDYNMTESRWNLTSDMAAKNAYIWNPTMYSGDNLYNDWKRPYQQVFYANLVLERLKELDITVPTEIDRARYIEGSAHFYRAWAFFHLAQLYSRPYDSDYSGTDPGIPLRLESDILVRSTRSTVQEVYRQIISDLSHARSSLGKADITTRPSRDAACAMLSRVYLMMGEYSLALDYADSVLMSTADLLDYRTVDPKKAFPFDPKHHEVVYQNTMLATSLLNAPNQLVSDALYALYDNRDLRKKTFYRMNADGSYSFRGSYDGSQSLFNGITTAEMMLIRAECLYRTGRGGDARDQLNILLKNRMEDGYTIPLIEEHDLLKFILDERRRELAFRGVRWWDMRRLYNDSSYSREVVRVVGGTTYTLSPGRSSYVLPIPDFVIEMSGMSQNE